MSMFNTGDILETIEMFTQDNLDVRTVTMGISLLDCIDPDPKKACENIYNKITTKAANLVSTVEHISAEYGIPIINKRISVTPIAMLLGACPDADPVDFAKTLDAAGKKVGVNFVGGYSALVHKGFSAGDRRLIESIPRALAETDIVCSSVNIGATKAGLNMDAIKLMGEAVKKASGVLFPLLRVLVLVAAIGATMNVIPFFFYDLTEQKQKSYVRVLKVRAVFEDYGNKALKDKDIVEMIDLVNNAREMAVATPKKLDKSSYKSISDKAARKEAKKAYRADVEFNEEIKISQFVMDEMSKFDSELGKHQIQVYTQIFNAGLDGIKNTSLAEAKAQLKKAKAMSQSTAEEKEIRKFYVEVAKTQISSIKSFQKYYGSAHEFVELGFDSIEKYFNEEDRLDDQIEELAKMMHIAKKDKDRDEVLRLKKQIKELSEERKKVRKLSKQEMDKHAQFNRAAKPYVDAKKLLTQQENFKHFDEIAALYDTAKANVEANEKAEAEEEAKRLEEEKAELARRKAEKAAKKRK